MPNAASCLVSIEFGTTGPLNTSALACASGNYALLDAFHMMKRGEADVMIAAVPRRPFHPSFLLHLRGWARYLHATMILSTPAGLLTKDRDGFVFGEGAAAFVLETEEHAQARGARIYAEVLGGRLTSDAYHLTAPRPDASGAIAALKGTLASIGKSPEAINAIFCSRHQHPSG